MSTLEDPEERCSGMGQLIFLNPRDLRTLADYLISFSLRNLRFLIKNCRNFMNIKLQNTWLGAPSKLLFCTPKAQWPRYVYTHMCVNSFSVCYPLVADDISASHTAFPPVLNAPVTIQKWLPLFCRIILLVKWHGLFHSMRIICAYFLHAAQEVTYFSCPLNLLNEVTLPACQPLSFPKPIMVSFLSMKLYFLLLHNIFSPVLPANQMTAAVVCELFFKDSKRTSLNVIKIT